MRRELYLPLIGELKKYFSPTKVDVSPLFEVFDLIELPQSSGSSIELPPIGVRSSLESDKYYQFLLRRIFINKEMGIEQIKELSLIRRSSNERGILNNILLEILNECGYPLSLLGEHQTYHFRDRRILLVEIVPTFFIPGILDYSQIRRWEIQNTVYEKQGGTPFSRRKKITKEKFLSLLNGGEVSR